MPRHQIETAKNKSKFAEAIMKTGGIAPGRILYVDGVGGSDTLGHLYFRTLTAAKNEATTGDTIIVYPGTYEENDLLKDGVNWHFMAGALVTYTNDGSALTYGIFDDRTTGAVTCAITGDGDFHFGCEVKNYGTDADPVATPTNNGTTKGMLTITESDSDVTFTCRNVTLASPGYIFAFYIGDGTVSINFNDVLDTRYDTSTFLGNDSAEDPINATSSANGLKWLYGECYIKGNRIKVCEYAVDAEQEAGHAGTDNLWMEVGRLHNKGTNSSCVYIWGAGTSAAWKTWITVDEIISDSASFSGYAGIADGRHYLFASKVSAPDAIALADCDGLYWITCQKITGTSTTALTWKGANVALTSTFGGTAYFNVMLIETAASAGDPRSALLVDGGTLYLGPCLITQADGVGVTHAGGTANLNGVRIDTSATNTATNRPVVVSDAGLRLNGCTLICPAACLESIYAATAKTIKVYGQTFAAVAKHANVTVQVGTLTIDANVT